MSCEQSADADHDLEGNMGYRNRRPVFAGNWSRPMTSALKSPCARKLKSLGICIP